MRANDDLCGECVCASHLCDVEYYELIDDIAHQQHVRSWFIYLADVIASDGNSSSSSRRSS